MMVSFEFPSGALLKKSILSQSIICTYRTMTVPKKVFVFACVIFRRRSGLCTLLGLKDDWEPLGTAHDDRAIREVLDGS